ncbi:MAG: hypothetical protein ACRBEE_07885 [Arenicella sp.]
MDYDEEKGIIFDDGNNQYTIGDVRSLHFQRQLHNTLIGNQYEVHSLKKELEEKIKSIPCPTVTIDCGDGTTQVIRHPKYG